MIFGLFGHMLFLTALIPKRHLLEAVLLFSQDACVAVDLSAGDLVLYFGGGWSPVGFMVRS